MVKRTSRRAKKKVGRSVLRNKQHLNTDEDEELKNAPHSFVIHRGSVGENVAELTRDFRKVMEPFTASALRARKANKIKDFLAISGILHVSHICVFTMTNVGTYLKIARVPRGPTLYFKVLNYCLTKDVISSLKKQLVFQKQFQHSPLIILNNFTGEGIHLKLMASMFQNMFPTINLTKVNLNNIRRCVLINHNPETNEIDFRHYSIKVVPVGISKGVKKIIQSKVPDLSRFEDIEEFITKSNLLSESEADDPNTHVTLPQKISTRGNAAAAQSSIRLVEQGPRLTLRLVKIEEGFISGNVLYHSLKVKTEKEKEETLKARLEKRREKESRRKFQEQRKKEKEEKKEEMKQKSLQGMKKTEEEADDEREDNDAEWYRTEVGEEPEEGLFTKRPRTGIKRKTPFHEFIKSKRQKTDGAQNLSLKDKKKGHFKKGDEQMKRSGGKKYGQTGSRSQHGAPRGKEKFRQKTHSNVKSKPKGGKKRRK